MTGSEEGSACITLVLTMKITANEFSILPSVLLSLLNWSRKFWTLQQRTSKSVLWDYMHMLQENAQFQDQFKPVKMKELGTLACAVCNCKKKSIRRPLPETVKSAERRAPALNPFAPRRRGSETHYTNYTPSPLLTRG